MNQLVTHRPQALEPHEFQQLDRLASQVLSFRERVSYAIVRVKDEYGDIVERRQEVPAGPEIFKKGDVSERLLESICRPVNPRHLAVHLVNLSHHKPFCRGDEAWRVVCSDIMRDLEGVSEYAILKSCEFFRQQPDLQYFPDSAVFVKRTRDLDWSLKNVNADKPQKKDVQQPKVIYQKATTKTKISVARMCKLALKPKHHWTKWEVRFMEAYKKKGEKDASPE